MLFQLPPRASNEAGRKPSVRAGLPCYLLLPRVAVILFSPSTCFVSTTKYWAVGIKVSVSWDVTSLAETFGAISKMNKQKKSDGKYKQVANDEQNRVGSK